MTDEAAQAFYESGLPDLAPVVLGALRSAGRSLDPLDPDDLAALDEFHGLGRAATLSLADLAGLEEDTRVLDVGAGIGGPARALARHRGARVTALDPTDRFSKLSEELCRRTGLADRVTVVRGDARDMPFRDGAFDLALTQAVWPSIGDKASMLAEVHRVLVPGGRFAIFEAVRGPANGDLTFPLPWADKPEESFVIAAEDVRGLVEDAGFHVDEWIQGMDAVTRIGEVAGSGRPGMTQGVEGVDLSLVMPSFGERMAGLAGNVEAGRLELAMGLFSRS